MVRHEVYDVIEQKTEVPADQRFLLSAYVNTLLVIQDLTRYLEGKQGGVEGFTPHPLRRELGDGKKTMVRLTPELFNSIRQINLHQLEELTGFGLIDEVVEVIGVVYAVDQKHNPAPAEKT